MKRLLFLFVLLVPIAAFAQNAQRYFGYYAGDSQSVQAGVADLPEFQDHVNLYSITFWSGTSDSVAASEDWVLDQLERARRAHVHAIVPGYPFLFLHLLNEQGYRFDPGASAKWNSFVQKMVDRGLLIPGDPDRSTVVAIYIIDEPNGNEARLPDQNGRAHPALVNAVAAIRGNPATAGVPIASILTPDFDSAREAIKLLDWVGFDHYGISDNDWTNALNDLENNYAPGKKYIIVPGADNNCLGASLESPSRYLARMDSDPNVVWMAPFLWTTRGSCLGTRDLPSIRAVYKDEGLKIRNAACDASPASRWFCGKSAGIESTISLLLGD